MRTAPAASRWLASAALIVSSSRAAQDPCATSQVVLSTGYDHPSSLVLPAGAIDPRWIVVLDQQDSTSEPRAATVIDNISAWADEAPGSRWISSYGGASQPTNGAYVFKTVFCLKPEVDLNAATLDLGMRGDDECYAYLNAATNDVLPNGSAVPFHVGDGFSSPITPASYSLASIGAQPGMNTLLVRVQNTGNGAMGLNVSATLNASPNGTAEKPSCCGALSSLQGRKFADLNGDGVWTWGEPGVPGWRVDLFGPNNFTASALTDGAGYYNFVDLLAGAYTLVEGQRGGWTTIAPPGGVHLVSLAPMQGVANLDFANQPGPCVSSGGGGAIPASGTGDGLWPSVWPSAPMESVLPVYVEQGDVLNSVTLRGLTHTWAGDLQVVLETPDGRFNLLHRPGSDGSSFGCSTDFAGDYVIVDRVQTGPCDAIGEFACSGAPAYAPGVYEQHFGSWLGNNDAWNADLEDIPLTLGMQSWRLYVYDWVGGDVGALASWEVCLGARSQPPAPPTGAPAYACSGPVGPGGLYPGDGLHGTWPDTLPSQPLVSQLYVTVPDGSTKVTAVKLQGWQHGWYDDTQIVLQAPTSVGGQRYCIFQAHDGVPGGTCSDDFAGDYAFVDEITGLDDCGNPASYPPACSGWIPPGVYKRAPGAWPPYAGGVQNVPLNSIPIATGVWTLYMYDWWAGEDGSIDSWELCFDEPGPLPYCTGGTTSNGCFPWIGANFMPRVSGVGDCTITASGIDGNRTGLIFYGLAPANTPWAAGSTSFLCVKSPTQRTPLMNSGGTLGMCDGSFTLDWNAYQAANPLALGQPWSVGDKVYLQAWFRDPPAPKSTSLSNALELTYLP